MIFPVIIIGAGAAAAWWYYRRAKSVPAAVVAAGEAIVDGARPAFKGLARAASDVDLDLCLKEIADPDRREKARDILTRAVKGENVEPAALEEVASHAKQQGWDKTTYCFLTAAELVRARRAFAKNPTNVATLGAQTTTTTTNTSSK